LDYEEGDYPQLLDDAGVVIVREISAGEFTTEMDYELHYAAPGESSLAHLLTHPDYLAFQAQDEAYLYVSYLSPPDDGNAEWVGRLGKPGDPDGLGGGTAAPPGLDPVIEHTGSNPNVAYFGQNDTQIFFTYTSPGWFEGQVRSVDKASGEEELVAQIEGLVPSSPGLVVGGWLYVVTEDLTIVSGSTTPGDKEATGTVPNLCTNVRRNDTRTGWWALCEGDSGTTLVAVNSAGAVTALQEGIAWGYVDELPSGQGYVRGGPFPDGGDTLSLYDLESSQLRSFPLEGTDYLGVVDGYVYALNEPYLQLVRAPLPW